VIAASPGSDPIDARADRITSDAFPTGRSPANDAAVDRFQWMRKAIFGR